MNLPLIGKINTGMINVRITRTRFFVSLIQLFMIGSLYFTEKHFNKWWLLLIPILIVINIFDIKRTYRHEIDYNFNQSKSFVKLCKDVEEIKRLLNE